MERKTKKRLNRLMTGVLVTSVALSITGCRTSTRPISEVGMVESISETVLNEVYKNGIVDEIVPIVYGEIEKQVVNKVESTDLSEIVSDQTYDLIQDKIIETVIFNYTQNPGEYWTDKQAEEVRELIEATVKSVDADQLTATVVAEVSEQTKAELSNLVATEVKKTLDSITGQIVANDKNQTVLITNLSTKTSELENNLTSLTKQMTLSTSYILTDADISKIEQIVNNKLASSNFVDKQSLQTEITNTMSSIVGTAVKGDKGDPGYTPVKGVDYFTEEDISAIVSRIGNMSNGSVSGGNSLTDVQIEAIKSDIVASLEELHGEKGDKGDPGQNGYTPVKGTDYFTEEEISSIKKDILSQINVSNGTGGYIPVKGVDYFTDEEVAEIAGTVVNTVQDYFDELEACIQANADAIAVLQGEKSAIEADLDALSTSTSELVLANNSQDTKITALRTEMNEKAQKIEEIDAKIAELEGSYLDLSTYSTFVSTTNQKLSDLADADGTLQASVSALQTSVEGSLAEIEEVLASKQNSGEFDMLEEAFNTFKTSTNQTLDNLATTCTALSNAKLDSADFEAYVAEQNESLADVQEAIASFRDTIGTFSFATEDYTTLSGAVASLQSQINTTKGLLETETTNRVSDINTIKSAIGSKEGTLYEEYSGSLWSALSDFKNTVDTELGEQDSTAQELDEALSSYKSATDEHLQSIDSSISSINTALAEKLNTTVFEGIRQITRLPEKVSPPDRGGES